MQFCDLNRQYAAYQSEMDEAIHAVIRDAAFIQGKAVETLEDRLAAFTGVKHAIACSSGTDALLLALMVKNLEPGDEVLCPAFSFFASASMVSFLKATPVFVDVSPLDFNIDVQRIAENITPKTRGIIAVSLFGQCADFDAINQLADQYGLWVIEDGAQSFGAKYHGKRSCSLTELAVTSFFPAKPLGCYGDGGAVFTNSDEHAARLRMLRSHGQARRYEHHLVGLNARMDTLQAAVLNVKLNHFEAEIINRKVAAQRYNQILEGLVLLPEVLPGRESVWAQYTIGVENRDELRIRLQEKGIPTAVHYPLILPRQQAFDHLRIDPGDFEVSDLLSKTVLSLPMHGLINGEEIDEVCSTIKSII